MSDVTRRGIFRGLLALPLLGLAKTVGAKESDPDVTVIAEDDRVLVVNETGQQVDVHVTLNHSELAGRVETVRRRK